MEVVGVVVEYNPFHNGHQFHLSAARADTGADLVIAVMSGNFLQRGEPALCDKWTRARMALLGGADLVFELPYQFAVQQAETFADGAVSILSAAGCRSLCFGSEAGDTSAFIRTLDFLEEKDTAYQHNIKAHLSTGVSYPKAASLSFKELQPGENLVDLSLPNNILGLQYIRAIRSQTSRMKPVTITRKNAGYHDEHFSSESIASATSIRKAIQEGQSVEQVNKYFPPTTSRLLQNYLNTYGQFHTWDQYWPLLKYRLIQCSAEELREIYEMEEGLEHRVKKAAITAVSFSQFMESIKTKRYTWTRLQRACVHILTNAKKTEMEEFKRAQYLRLLGMTQKGRRYLQSHKKNLGLPLVSKASSCRKGELDLDIKASRIYSLGISGRAQEELLKKEFAQSPVFEDSIG
ncbi:nucleotidyltransferase [Mesobacillus zeae]|uniref:tRNA(Met) cytidine acetate ligase n=1 Tax=Mesobacillus zeae TaxID=1917180 RepID=A0A398BJH9_9BACI|nr:nucleotidyltransferase [Mesobacillus zeae]RID87890.1 nucleotidyltransferase [Mesobacillus zeae]